MGLVNTVVPLAELEKETVAWCREMLALSPLALRLLKSSFNADRGRADAGIQQLSHDATLLFYMTEEGQEGRNAFGERRPPDFSKFPQAARDAGLCGIWLMAARPRTLPAAIAPVLVGTAAAVERAERLPRRARSSPRWSAAIFIQIGTNLANDYSDAAAAPTRRPAGPGAGDRRRTGDPAPRARRDLARVRRSRSAAGIYLATVAGPVIIAVGVVSILAGVLYTGGPRPYGYAGLGELFVFLFFGLVAVNGSYYVQLEELDWLPFGLSVADRAAGDGDPRRQQHPRHRDRPPRRQEDARGADRPRRRARPLRRAGRGAYLVLPIALSPAGGPAWALLGWLGAAAPRPAAQPVLTRPTAPR